MLKYRILGNFTKSWYCQLLLDFWLDFCVWDFFLVLLKNSKIIQNGSLHDQHKIGKKQQLKMITTKFFQGTSSTLSPVKSIDLSLILILSSKCITLLSDADQPPISPFSLLFFSTERSGGLNNNLMSQRALHTSVL